jgi:ubiquinone/menaquinone biosynthesis C-methylase UbiE
MIEIAKGKNMGIQFQVGNILKLSYPDDSFDIVVSRGILISHIPYGSQEIAIKEVARVIKPGALVIYDYLHDLTTRHEFLNYSSKKASYDKRKMIKLLKKMWYIR